MRRINADHASTTPIDRRVREAMLPHLGADQGNPSSLHGRGAAARVAVDEARHAVASLLGCPDDEILFTGSATEANNLAVKGVALACPQGGRLVAASTEHLSILHPLRSLAGAGYEVVLLPVDRHGLLDPAVVDQALAPGAALISVAHASAEIGTLQPIAAISRVARARAVPLHVDATASACHVALPADAADLLTIAPHLFYGPLGTAALRVRSGVSIRPLIEGGTQEAGLRPGSEAVGLLAGFGVAAGLLLAERGRRAARASRLARRFRRALAGRLDRLTFTGHPRQRIPGHVSLCAAGVEAEAVLVALDVEGIEAASGSPCTTLARRTSHVLEAIGTDPVLARGALTFMFGEDSDESDPAILARALTAIVQRLRRMAPDVDRPDGPSRPRKAVRPAVRRASRGRRRSGSSGESRSSSAAGAGRRA